MYLILNLIFYPTQVKFFGLKQSCDKCRNVLSIQFEFFVCMTGDVFLLKWPQ